MNDRFLRACRCLPVDRAPLWIMRQAGRYLPEYRALRSRVDFLTLCRTPELAVEASLQPLARFPLDAAIVFSDLLLPLELLGRTLLYEPGPRVDRPVRTRADIEALSARPAAEGIPYLGATVALLRRELADRLPVIGFAGAPFTLATYLADREGRGGPGAAATLLYRDPDGSRLLLEKLADLAADCLELQIVSGASAVQIFDSWAGVLDADDYRAFALPAVQRMMPRLRKLGVPIVYFAVAAGHQLEAAAETGADVIGLCWRTPLDVARRRLGARLALQGNLDPHVLLAPPEVVRARARDVLERGGAAPGHVMNLGHGILPETPIASVEALVETVISAGVPSR
jgi:uroporphyrinogen decarboxylase